MMRLSEPRFSFEQAIDECIAGITGSPKLRQKMVASKAILVAGGALYIERARAGELCSIAPVVEQDPVVLDDLKKSELIKIYDDYFVPETKPARKIYDALRNAAKEQCPFCGGIGTPHNLDHFLPKAHFPQLAVLPHNLVPSCRDCNMDGKGHAFASKPEDQIIQPYADKERFFLEQWIFAECREGMGGRPYSCEYFVRPPVEWPEIDKNRARTHFRQFALGRHYGTKAGEQIGTVLRQVGELRTAGLSDSAIETALLRPGVELSPFPNHWQRGFYQAVIDALRSGQIS